MQYTLYDASGNTFVIFHTNKEKDYSKLAIKLCQKENTDGLIVIVPHFVYDFKWLFYNNDGSIASMCGNGTRAVAHYALDNNLCGNYLKFLTLAGQISCKVNGDIVQTTMPKPKYIKATFEEFGFEWVIIDTGVPHLVSIVDDLKQFDKSICSALRKKYNANVNFAVIHDEVLYVRTYERGVENETLACGTGMVASFVRARELNKIPNKIKVYPKSNELLNISYEDDQLLFEGKVRKGDTKYDN